MPQEESEKNWKRKEVQEACKWGEAEENAERSCGVSSQRPTNAW
jgi:hypothetical protein